MLKNWIYNILLGLVAVSIAIWLIFMWMNWYTRHNSHVTVPNIKGITLEEAASKLDEANLRFEVFDSVYNEKFKKDAITEQDPSANAKVKPGRIIYLTVNSLAKPKVKMPKLVDQSLTLSKAMLNNLGLEIGNIEYKFDEIGQNLVLEQLHNGRSIPPGKVLEKGSIIDLVVATNRKGNQQDTTVTDIIDPGAGTDNSDENP